MIKPWKQFLILVAVFIVGVLVFSRMTNHEIKDLTTDMQGATLPIVYILEDGEPVNEMHGYAQEMEQTSMRDTITPVNESGILPIQVDTYGNEIQGIFYEVRSLDTTRLVQQTDVQDIKTGDASVTGNMEIRNLLTPGEEYLLTIRVTAGDTPYYYYTRIIQGGDNHVTDCLAFVHEFHGITMDKERQIELSAYMETLPKQDNATLQKVTINNTAYQACWGEFVGEEVTTPVASIKELNDSYNVILLNYIMSAKDENGADEYYNVEEYYRVRYGKEKMYLLSFERTVEEIFRGKESDIQGSKLNLGIRSPIVDYKANEAGNVVCFVQQGELWSYNVDSNALTRVFSFRSDNGMDARENFNEHDIRIIRADEGGSVDFILYGYMNRGDHEGQVGISICHYDCLTNTVEEQLFVPSTDSYQMMKESIGKTMYISDGGMFYLVMGNQVHQVDLTTMESMACITDLTDHNFCSSDDGRFFAWTEGDSISNSVMHVTDFETASTRDVEVSDGLAIRPIGFLGSDCAYGLASAQYVSEETMTFPINRIVIIDGESLREVKTYDYADAYVTGTSVEAGTITLHRSLYRDGIYIDAEPDYIRNRDMQEPDSIYVSEYMSDTKEREITFQLQREVPDAPKQLTPKMIIAEKQTTLELSGTASLSDYYVYAKGRVLLGTNHVADAVVCADENRGVVIGENQTYIWKRAKAQTASLASTAVSDLSSATYNLTGCTLDQVLYFVGEGTPVHANWYGQTVLIVGYDNANVTIYDPGTDEKSDHTIKEMTDVFAVSGNIFYLVK